MTDKDILTMSAPELDRAMIIDLVIERRLSRADAAEQLGFSPRHVGRRVKELLICTASNRWAARSDIDDR